MTPETVLQTIRAVAEAITETLRWMQTEQGQEVVKRSLADRAALDSNLARIGGWFTKLFTGKL